MVDNTEAVPPGFVPGFLPCGCGRVHPVPTQDTLDAMLEGTIDVPWGKDKNGKNVYTNGIIEDALGLSPFIMGWSGDTGYITTDEHNAAHAAEVVASIDWDRVRSINEQFSVPFNYGDVPGMMFGNELLVSSEAYDALLQLCRRSVPDAEFEAAVKATWAGYNDRRSTFVVTARTERGNQLVRTSVLASSHKDAKNLARRQWYDALVAFKYDTVRARVKKEGK